MRSSLARALTGTALTAGMLAVGAGAAVANDTHTVRSGDTLSSIASQHDGVDSWRDLAELNSDIISNPNRIFIGQELALTGGSSGSAATAEPAESSGSNTHTVVPGDTLSGIAAQYADVTSWRALAEANADIVPNPSVIHVGQELALSGTATSSSGTTTSSSDTTTSSAEPEPEPEPTSTPTHNGNVSLATWDRLAECESNQTWDINTGNSFYGGLQFNKKSWDWAIEVGGHTNKPAYPHNATRMQQITVAETLLEIHPAGWGAWPACTRALGIR